ncbi:MAG: 3-isopropylmalate dehydratase large subunit [Rhodanobacteraceae bacterium]
MNAPRNLFQKIWDAHVVTPETADTPATLYIDLHLVHEVTSPQAFDALRARGLKLRQPGRTLATLDHSTPTRPPRSDGERPYITSDAKAQVAKLEANTKAFGVDLHGWGDPGRGIVHVIGPELGATQPGMTIVCGDSHTSTHGAFGALAFGIGTTEVGHVLATQCLLQRKPKTLAIHVDGVLPAGVTAKDLVLSIIGQIGTNGGTGHVIEYRGPGIEALSMEERMTVCNMSIEAGARAGLIAPDETTFAWLKGRPKAPQGGAWDAAVTHWQTLRTDAGARYDREVHVAAAAVKPTVTWGTHPGTAIPIDAPVPVPRNAADERAQRYMQSQPGKPMQGTRVDVVFIGSCTNARVPDLRLAAEVMRGRHVAAGVRMLVVPGSERVRRDAEAEGLDKVFLAAGAEWRMAGCSMCIGMNGDTAKLGELVVSTSNRNFEGRQGKGVRTVLASPATAAASAVAGRIADPREYLAEAAA